MEDASSILKGIVFLKQTVDAIVESIFFRLITSVGKTKGGVLQELAVGRAHGIVLREGQHRQVTIDSSRNRTVPRAEITFNLSVPHPLVQSTEQAVPNWDVVVDIGSQAIFIGYTTIAHV